MRRMLKTSPDGRFEVWGDDDGDFEVFDNDARGYFPWRAETVEDALKFAEHEREKPLV